MEEDDYDTLDDIDSDKNIVRTKVRFVRAFLASFFLDVAPASSSISPDDG